MTSNLTLPFDDDPAPSPPPLPDRAARDAAVDPGRNVVLEASAGTGKTRVLVDRYLNLLRAGVEPANILAITFTRKAAAEMRQRIVQQLRDAASASPADAARWRALRDRLGDIAISTIDAFCLSLLREFPLEADLDPAFEVADETEIPRLVGGALDRTVRICRHLATEDEDIALVFAQLGEERLRQGLAALLDRRLVAGDVLRRFLAAGPRDLTLDRACALGAARLRDALVSVPGGIEVFLDAGPVGHPKFAVLARDVRALLAGAGGGAVALDPSRLRGVVERVHGHFFTTTTNTPRQKMPGEYREHHHPSRAARRQHFAGLAAVAGAVGEATRAFRRDLNVVLSRGVWRMFSVAVEQYRRTLDQHGVLDFAELLSRASDLLGQMDEFAQSRFRLEARYHHILVDEFQDTSRAQWDLVSQLVRTWGEGFGLAHEAPIAPTIFVVGDRKQSIYGFRDAEVTVLDEAARAIGALRPDESPLRSISHSFRSAPALLAFANDLFAEVQKAPDRDDGFRYDQRDAFPIGDNEAAASSPGEALGIAAAADGRACAAIVAEEIARLLQSAVVRDRLAGTRRPIRPADIAVLFRSRDSHREFEQALESRGVPTYVYKGLGFFDADETKDAVALLRYLADPGSDLRAAAFLRSRLVRVSDAGLLRLAPRIASSLTGDDPAALAGLDDEDRAVVARARQSLRAWLPMVDRVPPSELLDAVLADSAYASELKGPRLTQARENLKKIRSLVRRIQNRGYLTMGRLAAHLDRLSSGDESNAVVDAIDAVSLMTVHAAKGLEFPVVVVVNMARGTGGAPAPIRVASRAAATEAVAIGDFRSEADEDQKLREQEETKRLLYVAVTRARDRLYLVSTLEDGTLRPRSGSLAEVLPPSVGALFAGAATSGDGTILTWQVSSHPPHRFRVCAGPSESAGREASRPAHDGADAGPGGEPARPPDDFEPVLDIARQPRVAATTLAASAGADQVPAERPAGGTRNAAIGTVVHRLFEIFGQSPQADLADVAARATALLREDATFADAAPPTGQAPPADPAQDEAGSIATDAARVFMKMRQQQDVAVVFDAGPCLFEVPFSLRLDREAAAALGIAQEAAGVGDGLVVRGAIDCLGQTARGSVVVVDFKTGAPKAADLVQVDLYLLAARSLFPGRDVRGLVVYPDHAVWR